MNDVEEHLPPVLVDGLHLSHVTGEVAARDECGDDSLRESATGAIRYAFGGEERRAGPGRRDDVP